MAKKVKSFEELYQNRKKWVESSEENGFNEGLERLLTELYPDKAHFIYELLQNAEDAKATNVSFVLHDNRLDFIHNGSRLFNLEDIDSITSIANTTKTKEDHSIGKFGVGFKAVFSYTQTPKIYSGEWSFVIKNLVIPTPIDMLNDIDLNKTYFSFPFNNIKKTPEKAYNEIKSGLTKLPPETLLFLNNICELTYKINNKEYKISKYEQDNIVSLFIDNDDIPVARYLKFTQNNIDMETRNGLIKNLSVSLAYKLEINEKGKLKIISIPSSNSNVFIYFPAEKENSKLRFLINAPFDSEVSRASVRDTDDNMLLINEIVKLQIKTMPYLRDKGYLTTEFLGVLPNSHDNLSEVYKSFHKELVNLFNNNEFTPTMNDKFYPAKNLYKGNTMYTNGPHIAEFIKDHELHKMLKANDDWNDNYNILAPSWVKNSFQNSLSDFFLQDLQLNKFEAKEFCEWFEDDTFGDNSNKIKEWNNIVEKKDFNDLAKLYRMFYQYNENNYLDPDALKEYALFRCTDGNMYTMNDKIYVQPEEELDNNILNSHLFIDKKSFGTSQQQKNKIQELFFDCFGIEHFSIETLEKEKFNSIKKKYSATDLTIDDISINSHITDILFIIKYYDNHKNDFRNKIHELKYVSFILTSNNEYTSIEKVYADTRYGNQHDLMSNAKNILNLSEISIQYKEKLNSKQVDTFIEILTGLNIHKQLWIVPCKDNPNKKYPTHLYNYTTSYCRDYDIYKLQNIIASLRSNQQLSKLIWYSILNISDLKLMDACYRVNQQYPYEKMSSLYIHTLSTTAWILDKNGYLQNPKNVTFDDLPDNWKRPNEFYDHPILKAIEFGKNNKIILEKQKAIDLSAKEMGWKDAKEAYEFKKLSDEMNEKGVSIDDVRNIIQRKHDKICKSLPEAYPKNIERRQEKIIEEYENAEEQVYEMRLRSVKVSGKDVKVETLQYLKDMYTNEDNNEMICQMCQTELPFKKRNNEYYFEATQMFNKMPKEDKHQFLALCPNCAAEYDEWVRKDANTADTLLNNIAERKYINGEKNVTIKFSIHNEIRSLLFTGTHYFDLRNIICPNADNNPEQIYWASLEDNNIPFGVGDIIRSKHFGEGKIVKIINKEQVEVQFFSEQSSSKMNIDYLEKKME